MLFFMLSTDNDFGEQNKIIVELVLPYWSFTVQSSFSPHNCKYNYKACIGG